MIRPVRLKIIAFLDYPSRLAGGFLQAVTAIRQLQRLSVGRFDFDVAVSSVADRESLSAHGVSALLFKNSPFDRVAPRIRSSPNIERLLRSSRWVFPLEKQLRAHGADLVYFLSPSGRAVGLSTLPYCFTVWDLCHRDFPEFPEVRALGEFGEREWLYRNALPRASVILTDSEELKRKMADRYGVDRERIIAMPFSPPTLRSEDHAPMPEEVQRRYGLQRKFYFYPAKLWPHKNHVRIIEAMSRFGERGLPCPMVVFSGSDYAGRRAKLEGIARQRGLSDSIKFLGHVPQEDVVALYRSCIALLMPTYFGPTNLPPLEAWQHGAPVISSRHLSDHLKDAALLVDPDDAGSLFEAMVACQDESVRSTLIERGSRRLAEISREREAAERSLVHWIQRLEARSAA